MQRTRGFVTACMPRWPVAPVTSPGTRRLASDACQTILIPPLQDAAGAVKGKAEDAKDAVKVGRAILPSLSRDYHAALSLIAKGDDALLAVSHRPVLSRCNYP